ncbi:MAG TPA: ABC transporter substrate-binding protein/permease [Polyangiaceae bacterium]|nr:ABC transporter substrate-binding protein/permease [Polyangiaceae bacterium]
MKIACLSLAATGLFLAGSSVARANAPSTPGPAGFASPASTAALAGSRASKQSVLSPELRWGGDLQGGEPYVFEAEGAPDGIRGFEVDIARALARRLDRKAHFVQTDWSKLVPALERRDFDIILNGLEDTPERRARLGLSRPYFVYGETLTVRRTSPLVGFEGLAQRRVGTLSQTVAEKLLREHDAEVVLYEGQQEPYLDLLAGRVEAVLLDHPIAQRYGCNVSGLTCVSPDLARGHYVIATLPTERGLLESVDRALEGMRRDGELRHILEQWKLWDERQAEPSTDESTAADLAGKARGNSAGEARRVPSLPHEEVSFESPRWSAHLRLFLEGALLTLLLSLASFALASPLGISMAIVRLYGGRVARSCASAYVELFRGTPLLLQLYVLYFGISDYVRLSPIFAAVLGLTLNYGAYEAEVHRGALLALPRGQLEAARALGFSRWQALRHVLLPQSLRQALPAATNDFVALLKDSSQVSVITVVELTKRMTIVAVEVRDWMVPGLLCAALYFILGFPLTRLSRRLERRAA